MNLAKQQELPAYANMLVEAINQTLEELEAPQIKLNLTKKEALDQYLKFNRWLEVIAEKKDLTLLSDKFGILPIAFFVGPLDNLQMKLSNTPFRAKGIASYINHLLTNRVGSSTYNIAVATITLVNDNSKLDTQPNLRLFLIKALIEDLINIPIQQPADVLAHLIKTAYPIQNLDY